MATHKSSKQAGKPAPETFASLCKELGKKLNATDNALLCCRAWQAYLREHPETGQGKAPKEKVGSRSNLSKEEGAKKKERAFRHEAAKIAGVAPATIDALLQVGKAIVPLSAATQTKLRNSQLSNFTRGLRKLATVKDKDKREKIIENVAKLAPDPKDPKSVVLGMKRALGMTEPKAKKQVVASSLVDKRESLMLGEHNPPLTFNVGTAQCQVVVTLEEINGQMASLRIVVEKATKESVESAGLVEVLAEEEKEKAALRSLTRARVIKEVAA